MRIYREIADKDSAADFLDMSNTQKLPAIRSDIEIVTQIEKIGSCRYFVKDTISGEVFEFGEEEYFICKQLDGQASLSSIQSAFKKNFNLDISPENLEAFVNQLGQLRLLAGSNASSSLPLFRMPLSSVPDQWKKWVFFNPNRILTWLTDTFQWCFSKIFLYASIVLFLLAIGVVYNNFPAFLNDIYFLFLPLSIVQVFLVFYFFINIPAVFTQGIVTIHYGGAVDAFGIHLAFNIFPIFYCENSIWPVKSKSGRNWIIFSLSFYRMFILSLGVLCWKMTSPAVALHTLGITLAILGFISLIVRLNVLWPTDMSYLLANWLEIPEFRKRAIEFFKGWLFHRSLTEPLSSREKKLFIWYGLLAGGFTLVSIILGLYFIGKWLIKYFDGTGALILLAGLTIKYYIEFSQRYKQKEIV